MELPSISRAMGCQAGCRMGHPYPAREAARGERDPGDPRQRRRLSVICKPFLISTPTKAHRSVSDSKLGYYGW
eukprot:6617800-Pyramimonas_sp.AAC.1